MIECQDIYTSGKESAKNHSVISHYTSLEALQCIIENRSLRLSRLDILNDVHEGERVDDVWKDKIFSACFTYRKSESFMFWCLYAKKNGVMLTFKNEFFYNENFVVYADAACSIPFESYCRSTPYYRQSGDHSDWLLRDITYADVAYTSNFNEFKTVDEDLKELFDGCIMTGRNKDFTHTLYSGLVKGIEWDSEEEVRFRVALSYKGLSNSPLTGSPSTSFKHVYIPIADALKSMTVTMNPWCCDSFEKSLIDLLKANKLTANCKILDSTLRNQVRREKCL